MRRLGRVRATDAIAKAQNAPAMPRTGIREKQAIKLATVEATASVTECKYLFCTMIPIFEKFAMGIRTTVRTIGIAIGIENENIGPKTEGISTQAKATPISAMGIEISVHIDAVWRRNAKKPLGAMER